MATEQKKDYPTVVQTPPEYSDAVRSRGVHKSTVVLSVYASAVTALLLGLAIFGSIMYSSTLKNCSTDNTDTSSEPHELKSEKVEVDDNGKKTTEESELDAQKELEIIRLGSIGEETDGATIVLDYKRRLTGMFLPQTGECYIIGGVNHDLRSPFRKTSQDDDDDNDNNDKSAADKAEEYQLKKADDYPLVNTDILPDPLQETCEGKNIYWLERTTEIEDDDATSRERRCALIRVVYSYCCRYGYYGCLLRCYAISYYLLC